VRQAGGELRFHAYTTAVEFRSRVTPPYFGFGQAHTQRIQGEQGPTWIDLKCARAGHDRQYNFLWRGFGFAWADVLQVELCGNPLELKTERVGRMRRWSFPFFGYGYAWAETMQGTCGEQLTVRLNLLEKRRFSRRRFPHLGYGYAVGRSVRGDCQHLIAGQAGQGTPGGSAFFRRQIRCMMGTCPGRNPERSREFHLNSPGVSLCR